MGSATPVLCRTAVQKDTSFAKLVSLGCHDVRTPLATVHGFAKTLERVTRARAARRPVRRDDRARRPPRWRSSSTSCRSRRGSRSGTYEPELREADTLALAQAARERLGDDRVHVSGEGATISTDLEAVERGVSALIQASLRHGGLDEVDVVVRGAVIEVSPVTDAALRRSCSAGSCAISAPPSPCA